MKNYRDNLTNWNPKIRARGKDYFLKEKVGEIHQDGNRFWAQVQGSQTYLVTLEFDEDKNIIASSCNCPFPNDCKHEAALCYALDAMPKKTENSVEESVESLNRRLMKAEEEKNAEAFSTLAFSYAGMLPLLPLDTAFACVERYFLTFFREEAFSREPRTFDEYISRFQTHMTFQDELIQKWIVAWDKELQKDVSAHDRMVVSLLGSPLFTIAMQSFLCAQENALNRSALFALRHRDLPDSMLPAFVLLLGSQRPQEIPSSAITNAKKEYKLHEQPEKVLALLRLSLATGSYEDIHAEDFQYLRSVGLSLDAKDLAENVFKQTDRFEDYLQFRSFYNDDSFSSVALRVAPFLSGKSYLSTVMVFDGERYFPRLNSSVKNKKYDWRELYQARSYLKEAKIREQLQTKAREYIENELAKKRHDLSYFDALLFLSFCHDPELSYFLSLPIVQEDAKNGAEKAIWLWLLSQEGRLIETGRYPYEERKTCS